MKGAYYNEFDPYAAEWLRNLIWAGHIAAGDVDERSIEDVLPADLKGYTQCHFFAGIGVWSLALRRAGWDDSRSVWTGSCPCQPFSAAGKGAGFADERHLWPAFHHLIRECQPAVVFGEQVASKDADPWVDLVCNDLETLGYAVGAVPFPSAGVGAPHIRDRLYWVANTEILRWERQRVRAGGQLPALGASHISGAGGLGDSSSERFGWRQGFPPRRVDDRAHAGRVESHDGPVGIDQVGVSRIDLPGPANSLWSAADWLACRDGRWRPVEPGTFPLAHGAPARVGRLRAYGNAINAEAARVFIEAVMNVR